MIVTEHVVRDIIKGFPEIQLGTITTNVKFHWGDEKELNRYIQLNKTASYPLVWLLPSEENYIGALGQNVNRVCSFVIATRETRKDLFNNQRYAKSFDVVLNPILGYLVHGLSSSNITSRINDSWKVFKFPNYSASEEGDENGTIDLWDAIKLDIEVNFNGDLKCLKPISYGE